MVGVELAPPAPGLRWGRRVCAGAVERGVLLRPLGDVVVLMPPLTITEDEVVRMVDALDGGLDEVRRREPALAAPHAAAARERRVEPWRDRIRVELARVVDEGRWRVPA